MQFIRITFHLDQIEELYAVLVVIIWHTFLRCVGVCGTDRRMHFDEQKRVRGAARTLWRSCLGRSREITRDLIWVSSDPWSSRIEKLRKASKRRISVSIREKTSKKTHFCIIREKAFIRLTVTVPTKFLFHCWWVSAGQNRTNFIWSFHPQPHVLGSPYSPSPATRRPFRRYARKGRVKVWETE